VVTLETRLGRLEAERDIAELFGNYAAACDTPDPDLGSACFAPGSHLSIRPSAGAGRTIDLHGPEQIKQFFARLPARREDFRQHGVLENRVSFAEDGQSATSESIFFVLRRTAGDTAGSGAPVVDMFGRYSDELLRIEGRWYLQSRRAMIDADRGAVR
jgi:hypothetical protein